MLLIGGLDRRALCIAGVIHCRCARSAKRPIWKVIQLLRPNPAHGLLLMEPGVTVIGLMMADGAVILAVCSINWVCSSDNGPDNSPRLHYDNCRPAICQHYGLDMGAACAWGAVCPAQLGWEARLITRPAVLLCPTVLHSQALHGGAAWERILLCATNRLTSAWEPHVPAWRLHCAFWQCMRGAVTPVQVLLRHVGEAFLMAHLVLSSCQACTVLLLSSEGPAPSVGWRGRSCCPKRFSC